MNGSEVPLARTLRGPVTLITLGILFALNNFTPYGFGQTWPVLLIVFGLFSLLARGGEPPAQPQYPPRPWNYQPPPPPPPDRGVPGGYRDSSYTGTTTPGGAAKGGFGTSAPQRPPEPGPTNEPGEST
jgi:cell wall-active antibiotic response 4TMS protein YvqF